jgi:hypothetical protein
MRPRAISSFRLRRLSGHKGRLEAAPRTYSFFTEEHRLALTIVYTIIKPLITLPKPRGFWDYALFALATSGFLILLFWSEVSDGLRWADATFAFTAAALFVLAIVLARRGEKAKWIEQPTRFTQLLLLLGVLGGLFGAVYGDAYLLHRKDITFSRIVHDVVLALVCTAVTLWFSRSRPSTNR